MGCAAPVKSDAPQTEHEPESGCPVLDISGKVVETITEPVDYSPFITEGFVSMVGDARKVRVRILTDTGACIGLISEKVLPFDNVSDTGTSVLIRGIGSNSFSVPIHKIYLSSRLVDGIVDVGVHPTLPIEGVDVLLGNNLAGDRVWPEPVPPLVKTSPVTDTQQDDCATAFPEVFTACAITRAMSKILSRQSSSSGGENICSSSSSITVARRSEPGAKRG